MKTSYIKTTPLLDKTKIFVLNSIIWAFILIAFLPSGAHIEICSGQDGHYHANLSFCGISAFSKNHDAEVKSECEHDNHNHHARFHKRNVFYIPLIRSKTNLFSFVANATKVMSSKFISKGKLLAQFRREPLLRVLHELKTTVLII